ncbi:MAG: exonuclease domain-containing protein [Nonlabens sp.]
MYAVLDIESTGGQYNEEGITEIAIYRFDGNDIVDRFASLINPEKPIDPYVVKLTGINNKMLSKAPKFYEVAKRIIEITKDAVLVAHNAQFDFRILKLEFDRLGYPFEIETLCTVELSQKLLPEQESHSLGKLVRSLGIPITDRHRATGDALATVKLFKLLLEKDTHKKILQSSLKYIKIKQVDSDLRQILETLPTSTGLFYLYDQEDDIVLIGLGRNIRKQVNKLFLSNSSKARKITQATSKATFEKTGNELIATLKEMGEIKVHTPRFNRTRKSRRSVYYVFLKDKKLVAARKSSMYPVLSTFSSLAAANNFMNKISEDLEDSKPTKEVVEKWFARYSFYNRTGVLKLRGRNAREKSIVLIVNGEVKGYAFTDLQIQVLDRDILNNLITPVEDSLEVRHAVYSFMRASTSYQFMDL